MSESLPNNGQGAPAPGKRVEVQLTSAQAARLRALWQEHSGALHAMLVGWCGDAQNASDILQEVFRRLAGSPALMAKMNNARAFLAVAARRTAVDLARRSATRTAYHAAAGAETSSSENPGPTDEALRAAIAGALASLPADQRVVVEHKVLRGRTLDEIARIEGVSLNTVSSRLRYALDKIRGQLRPYYDDLNRKDFNNMKNDPSNKESFASERIITPLAPKRVPSVAPGLEGLAAMAPDACEAAPEATVYEPELVEAAPAVELIEPQIAFCGFGGNAWEANVPETVELPATDVEGTVSEGTEEAVGFVVSEEVPEMISCEILPEGGIPEEWLRPILVVESPEDFVVSLFEGEGETVADDSSVGFVGDSESTPWDLESGFEICVLPVAEEFAPEFDPNELLARYEAFLSQDPTWLPGLAENQGDWFHEQATTSSAYFEMLEFGTPGEASAFDHWFVSNFGAAADGTSEEGTDYGNEQPDYSDGSWSFDPKDLLVRYEDFLRENPDWGALDPDTMEIQVVTPSSYFGALEFGTPSKAAAFDSWYETNYAQGDSSGVGSIDGSGLVLDGSSNFDGGTVVTGGEIVVGSRPDGSGLTSGTSLVKDLLVRYEDFLRENPDWGALDPDTMEIQVVTPSSYFGALEFGTPSKAAAFDSWYETNYAQGDSSGVGPTDGSGLVLDGSSNFDGGTVVTGGEIVVGSRPDGSGLTSGTSLVLSGGGSFTGGTAISGGSVYSEDKAFSLETTGTITDGRNGAIGIPAEWMRGGTLSAPGLVLNGGGDVAATTSVTGGETASQVRPFSGAGTVSSSDLSLSNASSLPDRDSGNPVGVFPGSTVVTGGEIAIDPQFPDRSNPVGVFPGSTVVTGGEVAIDPQLYQLRYESFLAANPGWVSKHNGIDDAYDKWFDIAYGTGEATPDESEALRRIYTSDFAESGNNESAVADARSLGSDVQMHSEFQQLPFEVSAESANFAGPESVEPSLAAGGVSPAQMQIIEFGALSSSESVQSHSSALASQTAAGFKLPEFPDNGLEAADGHAALAPTQGIGHDAPFAGVAVQDQEDASAASLAGKVDAPTATAGAVAAGTVVHGGAAAPTTRRPFLKA